MIYFGLWSIVWTIVGSFGTAFVHEQTGRDVQMGGLIGALVGAVGGIFLLVVLWIWVYYGNSTRPTWRVINARRHWYNWWN